MTFEQMLRRAKGGDQEAITSILLMYRPLLLKYAVINGRLDEDLYNQEIGNQEHITHNTLD